MSDRIPRFSSRPSIPETHSKHALTRILVSRPIIASELLGALVYNSRALEQRGNIMNGPIPIGPLDQTYLVDMRVVRQQKSPEKSELHTRLTKLGVFVVEAGVFLEGSDSTGKMPLIDVGDILNRLPDINL
ncbi:MAG: hypothetical protein WBK76_03475 [Candidatus Saccharimonadales bacterium]|jgi:hypothetical protein